MKSTTMLSGSLIGVATTGMWLCSRSTQLTVDTVGDKSGLATADLVGTVWAPELMSIVLAMVAALFATAILESMRRRIVGSLTALFAIAASWTPITLLTRGEGGVNSWQVLDLLTSGSATQHASDTVIVADWVRISAIGAHTMGSALALLYCALALIRAVLLVRRLGTVKKQKLNTYEIPEVRCQRIAENLEEDPQSGRVLWGALDAGVDPTDLDKEQGCGQCSRQDY